MPEELRKALSKYYIKEFGDDDDLNGKTDLTKIGIAYTEYEDPSDYRPYTEAQVSLNLPKLQFEYYADGELFYTEPHKTLERVCDEVECCTFDGWIEDFDYEFARAGRW